ncbi:NAD(P)-dependent oxidoreductase [Williamsia phyllosphaerae]|uniref:3-hydroxyisobutyrate dehydrogenase n=1 Tax=Williamsia phyllosphaerae TaxID=885042 RepID=A0ABQ1V2Z6_9NOCA|nr:NAD(P)-dependent oxidoreductase [Williamsia phyllosphaerae]GGF32784.1 3-hydroxyisobutyrate dehydrogenase [Williamsia phyllosphaerae]
MALRVALLGTGLMGAGMARSMLRAGLDVTVWNRSADKTADLGEAGARVADDPADAVRDADIVVTMLFDVDSVEAVMSEAIGAIADGVPWVQTSTVGIAGVERLAALAAEHDVTFVDAPVLGTRAPAENGALTVLAGGPQDVRDQVAPLFDAIGASTVWVGEQAGDGHRLKLVANSWVLSITTATAQAVGMAQRLDIDPRQFLDSIAGGPLDCGYAQLKGDAMITGSLDPSFALDGAAKDSGLIADAMDGAGMDSTVMRAIRSRFAAAADAGHSHDDMAAVIHGFEA